MLLYYITDRRQFGGSEKQQRERLLAKIAEAASAGVDLIQLREKDLCSRELEFLVREAVRTVHETAVQACTAVKPRLLINSRADIALAEGADGVHLTSRDISAGDARAIFDISARSSGKPIAPVVVGVSCHTRAEVQLAESQGADFALFGPVFGKGGARGTGVRELRRVCRPGPSPGSQAGVVSSGRMPVLAVGGVTLDNARSCLQAGAAGIAAIRLFQQNDIRETVEAIKKSA